MANHHGDSMIRPMPRLQMTGIMLDHGRTQRIAGRTRGVGVIHRLQAQGTAMLHVSHFLEEMVQTCDALTRPRAAMVEVQGLAANHHLRQLDLALRTGEIQGLPAGSSRAVAARALFGMGRVSGGALLTGGMGSVLAAVAGAAVRRRLQPVELCQRPGHDPPVGQVTIGDRGSVPADRILLQARLTRPAAKGEGNP